MLTSWELMRHLKRLTYCVCILLIIKLLLDVCQINSSQCVFGLLWILLSMQFLQRITMFGHCSSIYLHHRAPYSFITVHRIPLSSSPCTVFLPHRAPYSFITVHRIPSSLSPCTVFLHYRAPYSFITVHRIPLSPCTVFLNHRAPYSFITVHHIP